MNPSGESSGVEKERVVSELGPYERMTDQQKREFLRSRGGATVTENKYLNSPEQQPGAASGQQTRGMANESRLREALKAHKPRKSDLVGYFGVCSCQKPGEMPTDFETEDEWIDHVLEAALAGLPESGGRFSDLLYTHKYQSYHLRSGCSCGWGTTLVANDDGYSLWTKHVEACIVSPLTADTTASHLTGVAGMMPAPEMHPPQVHIPSTHFAECSCGWSTSLYTFDRRQQWVDLWKS